MARNETLRTCHHNGHLRLQTRAELSETGGAVAWPHTSSRYVRVRQEDTITERRNLLTPGGKGDSNNVACDHSRHDIASHRYFSTQQINYIVTRVETKIS